MELETVARLLPDVRDAEITAWVARGWVVPDRDGAGAWVFADIDVARIRLIRDLRRDLDVSEDAVPLVLSLLDQLYSLRAAVRALSRAIEAQPEPVRDSLRAVLAAMNTPREPAP
jgi:chaperone modulatory protein CbpM